MTESDEFDKRGALSRAAVNGLASGPLNIMASLGPGQALAAGVLGAVVSVLSEAAASADGRHRVVEAGFKEMTPSAVEDWLARDTRHLTLSVQSVLRATAAFDRQKIDALGSAFCAGVVDEVKVDESIFAVAALGMMERPHIDLLQVVANEEAPLWSEQHGREDDGQDAKRRTWFMAGLRNRLPHLAVILPLLEVQLRTAGVTWRTEGFGGPFDDIALTSLGLVCIDHLSRNELGEPLD